MIVVGGYQEARLAPGGEHWLLPLLLLGTVAVLVVPVLVYVAVAYLRTGSSGLKSVHRGALNEER